MDYVKTVADEYKPWRRDVSWYAVAVQAAIAIAIGAYFLIAPDSANSTIRFLLAALLIFSSLMDIKGGFSAFNDRLGAPNSGAPFLLIRGGAGAAMGVVYFAVTRSDFMTESDARYVLGFGMIAYAVIGFIALAAAALNGRFLWPSLLANLLFLLLGGVLVYNRQEEVENSSAVEYLGIAAVIGGLCLGIYAWYLRSAQLNAPAPAVQSMEFPAPSGALPVSPSPLSPEAPAAGAVVDQATGVSADVVLPVESNENA